MQAQFRHPLLEVLHPLDVVLQRGDPAVPAAARLALGVQPADRPAVDLLRRREREEQTFCLFRLLKRLQRRPVGLRGGVEARLRQQFEIIRRFESFRSGSGENPVNGLAELAKINSSLPPHCHLLERLLPRLRCMWATSVEAHPMEKVVLLCLIIAIIGVLAELSPAARPQK